MPRYRVAVFPNNAASGATIGYYGTMLGICSTRRCSYWVYLPALDDIIEVRGIDLLVVGPSALEPISEAEQEWLISERRWDVTFYTPIAEDNAELCGSYRIGTRERGTFKFQKRDQSAPTWQFTIPTYASPCRAHLRYLIPARHALNRDTVMAALAAVLDVEPPEDVA
ncbi:MAG TPA: hypothetical protein VFB80_01645 [Pirellulaceae bacterium]|nr:hypothetical protein [Pirellulaceae bacterium]